MARIAATSWVAPDAVVIGDVSLGDQSSVWHLCVVRADTDAIVVGDRTNIQDGTIIHVDEGQPCTIGNQVSIGHRAVLHGCTIEDGVLVGIGAIVLNGATVGRGSVIAAGAVIPEGMTIEPRSLVVGVPGRVIGAVGAELSARVKATWGHYARLTQDRSANR
ncbi:MAG TPA: gamma carbonic anhydrase family protein [Candidatus Limnocylindrales bacterium]|jgi:carbonic anhydrase/acetyltransferase-like protein (isoleucine patch superfamily)